MLRLRLIPILLTLMFSVAAFGQATRTWVSGVGDDANPCSRTAPCKTFAGAISKTAAGGEINVIDPAAAGTLTITKSITVDGGGQFASTLATNGINGFVVNALTTDRVIIRNLSVNGSATTVPAGLNGIRVLQAGRVLIENVSVFGFSSRGIQVANTSNTIRVALKNVTVNNIGVHGVSFAPTLTGAVIFTMENVRSFNNGDSGAELFGNVKGNIVDSVFTGNPGSGLLAGTVDANVNVKNSVFSLNAQGVRADSTSVIRLSESQVTGNTSNGLFLNGGSIHSHGNNAIVGNTGNQTPTSVLSTQ